MKGTVTIRRGYRVLAAALAGVAAVCSIGACSSSPPGAAEPAVAPTSTASATGIEVAVGSQPEGIVYDSRTGLVAVAVRDPDRLVLVDATTLAVRRTVPLPGSVRHLQLAAPGGPVLVPIESAGEIGEVTLPGGALTTTKVEKQPHDAAVSGDTLVVGNEFGRSLSFLRGGRVVATARDVRQPGGVIADGPTVGVVDVGTFTLSTYSVATATRIARVTAGEGPTHAVLISGNRMLVSDTRGNQLLVFDVSPLRRVAALPLPGTPYGLAVDRSTGTVWVTLTARNEVVGVDVTGRTPKVIARYATLRQPNTVAVDPGSRVVWVTGTATGQIERITR